MSVGKKAVPLLVLSIAVALLASFRSAFMLAHDEIAKNMEIDDLSANLADAPVLLVQNLERDLENRPKDASPKVTKGEDAPTKKKKDETPNKEVTTPKGAKGDTPGKKTSDNSATTKKETAPKATNEDASKKSEAEKQKTTEISATPVKETSPKATNEDAPKQEESKPTIIETEATATKESTAKQESPTPNPETKPETSAPQEATQPNNNNKRGGANKKPLNVLIFFADDWRHDSIGGVSPVVQTPVLNQLAHEGIRFTHNMVTTSICWISRATLFTGQYASRHKSVRLSSPVFYDNWWNKTWPAKLQEAGYYVGHIGKWQFKNINYQVQKFFNFTHLFEGWHFWKGQANVDIARDDMFRFLQERPADRPFAMTIAFYPPKAVGQSHVPGAQWTPKQETRLKYYTNVTVPEPPYDVNVSHSKLPWFFQLNEKDGRSRWDQRFSTPIKYQEAMKNYYSCITDVDRAIGEILDELKRLDLYDNTLIIFTADNGLFHAEHGLAGKWYPYQESIRVPLIVRDPRMRKNAIDTLKDDIVLNIDLAPTILGAAGVPVPPQMQGRDFSDLYVRKPNNRSPWRREFFYEFPNDSKFMPGSTAVVRHDLKYIHWTKYKYEELFNLTADPLEQNNLYNDSNYAGVLNRMRQRHKKMKPHIY